MGSGVVYYKYEAHKEYDDVDVEPTTELRTIKICRYHFKDEKFTCSVYSFIKYDAATSFKYRIKCLYSQPLPKKNSLSLRLSLLTYPPYARKAAHTWSLPSPSSGIIGSSEGWMCEGDKMNVEEGLGLEGVKSEGSRGKGLERMKRKILRWMNQRRLMERSRWIRVLSQIFSTFSWEILSRFTRLPVASLRLLHKVLNHRLDIHRVVFAFKVATYLEYGLLHPL
ncbi:hypothetical protein PIB30_076047 [Stylosanthes scabra]|uniref:Uncharacterized protein n=1 Tax=Stylosanthes scabra TaxID=79078 RepID=A0ABU6XR48_9FABA|nr:hypothetical protein [Stylosanthes scabra]